MSDVLWQAILTTLLALAAMYFKWRLDLAAATALKTEKLVNSQYGTQLSINAAFSQERASRTQNSNDIASADHATQQLQQHNYNAKNGGSDSTNV